MKNFVEPAIEIEKFEIADIITTSDLDWSVEEVNPFG